MKENQTKCPCCGHEIEQTEWLFMEQWQEAYNAQCKEHEFHVDDRCYGKSYGINESWADGCTIAPETRVAKPVGLIGWEQANPQPSKTMIDVVAELYNHIFVQNGGMK